MASLARFCSRACEGFALSRDSVLLLVARSVRMLSFGAVSVVLYAHMRTILSSDASVGVLLTCILLGDLVLTLAVTTRADGAGRRRVLILGAVLKAVAGIAFGTSTSVPVLMLAGVLGVISPSGGEAGPFLALEQAALTDAATLHASERPGGAALSHAEIVANVMAMYQVCGMIASAVGALLAGWAVELLLRDASPLAAYQSVYLAYACCAGAMTLAYAGLSKDVEVPESKRAQSKDAAGGAGGRARTCVGLHTPESTAIVLRLSALFSLDAFAGGLVMQSWLAAWFAGYWHASMGTLGSLMMGVNVIGGLSGLAAGALVKRYGAVATMVFTHFPSNIILLAVPFMPSSESSMALLLLRYTISQMDVPARQAFLALSVAPSERSAAGGITSISRSLGVSVAPLVTGFLSAYPTHSMQYSSPFVIACVLKCTYDILVWIAFKHMDTRVRTVSSTKEPPKQPSSTTKVAAETADEQGAAEEEPPAPDEERVTLLNSAAPPAASP